MEKIRWGLLSTARINRRVIPAIRTSARGELVAVASRNLSTARSYAAEWDIPKVFGSYEAMLASDQVDCVYISLPNHLHAEWSIKAMQSGKHVLCEKPFAISVEEVDRMIDASRIYKRVLTEAFMYRHHPQTKLAGDWVRSGKLGEPIHFSGVFNFILSDLSNVRRIPEYGGGSLWDIGVYPMSLAQYLFSGPPEWVFGTQSVGLSGVDESFSGLLQYAGGYTAHIYSSFQSQFYTYAELIGTLGRLTFSRPFLDIEKEAVLTFYSNDGKSFPLPVPEQALYSGEIDDMHSAILDLQEPYISLEESRNHIRTTTALYQSAQQLAPAFLNQH